METDKMGQIRAFVPSYDHYKEILQAVKASGKHMDYREALKSEEFLILRHDIEFSIERAYKMALLEAREGICSSYFVQVTSDAYNAFSEKSRELLRQIRNAGHQIGLHYHLEKNLDPAYICNSIKKQIEIMSEIMEFPIDRFSIHRPVEESHYYDIQIEGIINAYGKEFFTHMEQVEEEKGLEVKYIADSKHQWNYGYPDLETFSRFPKLQLLIHPFSWSQEGKDRFGMFDELADEKEKETLDTFHKETRIYCLVKDQIERKRGIENGISERDF